MLTDIQRLYEMIPKSDCKDGCVDCCYDLIQVAPEEDERMGGYRWKEKCVHLSDKHCTVYENRALICRLFGTSETMRCDGCIPERYLTDSETKKIISEYTKIRKSQIGLSNQKLETM